MGKCLFSGGYTTRTSLQRQRTSSYSRKHSRGSIFHLKNMNIHVLSALDDNYMYLLVDERTKQAAAIDPVEPEKVTNSFSLLVYCIHLMRLLSFFTLIFTFSFNFPLCAVV